jgi:hypothetical protein
LPNCAIALSGSVGAFNRSNAPLAANDVADCAADAGDATGAGGAGIAVLAGDVPSRSQAVSNDTATLNANTRLTPLGDAAWNMEKEVPVFINSE